MSLALDDRDLALLDGASGPAMRLAMQLVLKAAEIMGARTLIPVSFAHIDACFYSGEAHVDFAQYLLAHGARLAIPAWTNNGVVSLADPDIRPEASDPQMVRGARRLMQLYELLGCRPVWTCAPYQLPGGPQFGDQIVAGESNAVSFYNAVIGARTNKYGDYLDVACALIGKAPYAGLHLDEGRRGRLLIRTEAIPESWKSENIFYHLLGLHVGQLSGQAIPVITGLPPQETADSLKALAAAAASSGGVEMWHAVGITPEAGTQEEAFQGRAPERVFDITPAALAQARRNLTSAEDGPLDMVALGTPHFSLTEFERLMPFVVGRKVKPGLAFYVSTSRHVRAAAAAQGWIAELERFGAIVIADTCTYYSPAVRQCRGRIMTNAAKWAYYAPGMLGVEVCFGSLAECVDSAVAGEVRRDPHLWANDLT
ncbi:MAG TPA: aconitase X catalytic domain-containing protein [Nordella sp.]|nr:aconitase X catalytic domain-containing protein [Nordella sp.]